MPKYIKSKTTRKANQTNLWYLLKLKRWQ